VVKGQVSLDSLQRWFFGEWNVEVRWTVGYCEVTR
jgi:hypothetical protein